MPDALDEIEGTEAVAFPEEMAQRVVVMGLRQPIVIQTH